MYIEAFIQHISSEKRYSPHTILAYRNDLTRFFEYIDRTFGEPDIKNVDHQMVRSWIMEMINDGCQPKSVNRKISALKTFYRFLRKNNMIETVPLDKIISPKVNKSIPEFVNRDQMDLLFSEVEFSNNFTGKRNRLIIELLYCTGIRQSELINLKIAQIDFYNSRISVIGKRNKERVIPFDTVLEKSLKDYLNVRNKMTGMRNEDRLFLTQKGKKIYGKLVYNIVNSYLSKVSTLKKKSPHVLRHTFATHMLNNGADLNAVKELLGHASLSATEVYTHTTIDKLKTIYNQAHPRA